MTKEVCNAHLEASEGLTAFAAPDVQVEFGDKVYPCHSIVLAMYSKVFGGMFSSTPSEEWGKGVSRAFDGSESEVLESFSKMCYVPTGASKGSDSMLTGVAKVCHKLDCPIIMQLVEKELMSRVANNYEMAKEMLPLSLDCDMEWLQRACLVEIFVEFMNKVRQEGAALGRERAKQMVYTKFKELESYNLNSKCLLKSMQCVALMLQCAFKISSSSDATDVLPGLTRERLAAILND